MTSVPGSGNPTVPIRRCRVLVGLAAAIGEVSLRPYPSKTTAPVLSSKRRQTSGGMGAPPEKQPMSEVRSYFCTWGWLVKAMKIVGTAGIRVGRSRSTSFRTSVNGGVPARGSGTHSSRLALALEASRAQVMPKTWYHGSTPR